MNSKNTPKGVYEIGADVLPLTGSRGIIIDIRETASGETIYGVRTTNGVINYYTSHGLKSSAGLGGVTLTTNEWN